MRSVVFAPFVISGAAIGIAFQFVFDPQFGLVRDLLARIGVASPDFYQQPGWALFMVTVTYIWKNLGYTFVIYLAALQGRRADLDEAAEIDGASAWTRFRRVPHAAAATHDLLPVDHGAAQLGAGLRHHQRHDPRRAAGQRHDHPRLPGLPGDLRQPARRLRRHRGHRHVRHPARRHGRAGALHGQGEDVIEHAHHRRHGRRRADAPRAHEAAARAARPTTSRPPPTTAGPLGPQPDTPAWSSSSSSSPCRSSGSSSPRSRSAATSTCAPPSGGPTPRRARTTAS